MVSGTFRKMSLARKRSELIVVECVDMYLLWLTAQNSTVFFYIYIYFSLTKLLFK